MVVDGWQTLNVNHVLPDVSLYHVVSHAWISMKYEQVNIHGDIERESVSGSSKILVMSYLHMSCFHSLMGQIWSHLVSVLMVLQVQRQHGGS